MTVYTNPFTNDFLRIQGCLSLVKDYNRLESEETITYRLNGEINDNYVSLEAIMKIDKVTINRGFPKIDISLTRKDKLHYWFITDPKE